MSVVKDMRWPGPGGLGSAWPDDWERRSRNIACVPESSISLSARLTVAGTIDGITPRFGTAFARIRTQQYDHYTINNGVCYENRLLGRYFGDGSPAFDGDEGSDYWYGWSHMLPAQDFNTGWFIIHEWHGENGLGFVQAPFKLRIAGGQYQLQMNSGRQASGAWEVNQAWNVCPLQPGVPTDMKWHIRWSKGAPGYAAAGSGLVDIYYRQGTVQTWTRWAPGALNIPTRVWSDAEPNGGAQYQTHGIYRAEGPGVSTMYDYGFMVATTEADIDTWMGDGGGTVVTPGPAPGSPFVRFFGDTDWDNSLEHGSSADTIRAYKVAFNRSVRVTDMASWIEPQNVAGTEQVRMVLWASSAALPGTPIAWTAGTAITSAWNGGSPGWLAMPLGTAQVVPAADYWAGDARGSTANLAYTRRNEGDPRLFVYRTGQAYGSQPGASFGAPSGTLAYSMLVVVGFEELSSTVGGSVGVRTFITNQAKTKATAGTSSSPPSRSRPPSRSLP